MAQDYRTLKLEVLAETKQFVKGMSDANKETLSFGDKLGDFAKKAGVALAAVGAAAGAMAIKIGKDAVAAASDLAESTSKVGVIFGDASEEIKKFAAQAATSLGQTRIQAQNAASTFATFGKAAGLTGKDLANFSTEFVTLASDIASFNNTSVDQAINALGAALRGESEPIRAYGVLLNDATLKAKAMEMGLYDGKGALDAQTKVLAAHQVVLAQTKDAQGDFARTADGMANSQKILTARLEEAKITLGEALLPVALNVVNFFNDKFLPVIEGAAGAFSNEEGSGLIDRVKDLVTQVKDFLNPIIETARGAFEKVSEALQTNSGNFKSVLDAIKVIYDFFQTYFVPLLKNNVVNAISGIGTAFSTAIKVIAPVIGTIADLIGGIISLVDKAIKAILGLVNTVINGINKAIEAYNKIPGLPNIGTIPNVKTGSGISGSNIVNAASLPSGFTTDAGAKISAAISAAVSPDGATIANSGSVTGGTKTKDGKQITDITEEIDAEIRRQEEIKKAMEATNQQLVAVMAARAAAGDITAAPVSIYVQSPSIIDEEGFSRAVVGAFNSVLDRTGGGGGAIRGTQQVL